MNKFISNTLAYIMLIVLSVLSSCSDKNPSAIIDSNAYVEAFTHGTISRKSTIYLIFNRDIESSKLDYTKLESLIKISPKVEGTFAFENNRTIAFKPADAFKRGESYVVDADLSEWFGEGESFKFSFDILTGQVRCRFDELAINEKNEDAYDVKLAVMTTDVESDADVEKAIGIYSGSKDVTSQLNCEWTHDVDGYHHTLTLVGVQSLSTVQTFTIKGDNSVFENNNVAVLEEVDIPTNEFDLLSINYVTSPERYIEVAFTKLLDEKANYNGLAFISDNVSEAVKVKGNTLRLFPDAGKSGDVLVSLSQNIRSKKGQKLGKDIMRNVEINKNENKPQIKLIGKGTIIPTSDKIIIPFQAVNVRGVVVRVVKVLSDNMGQFLQENDYSEYTYLTRVGRIIAYKTVFLDEDGADLTRWNNFGIDLKEIINPEPGTLYRVELSFDKSLSAWPGCENDNLSKSQIMANDKLRFKEECERFNNGSYYYTDYYSYWWDDEDEDPTKDSYYHGKAKGRNVLATNLGITAMCGADGVYKAVVNNLTSAKPESGVKIEAYNYQNQKIAEAETNSQGFADVKVADETNSPYYLKAIKGKEVTYLKVNSGNSLSYSAFDTKGEVVQKGLKGFIYGERGVWRPGDTLHLGFMLNEVVKTLPEDHPVVLSVSNPMGQVYSNQTRNKSVMGIYRFDVPTEPEVPTGIWTATVSVGGTYFSKNLRIETIKPNRLKINLALPKVIVANRQLGATLHSEWLNGSRAKNLKYDIEATFYPTKTEFDNYKDYVFDSPATEFTNSEYQVANGVLSNVGDANINVSLSGASDAPGMLIGNFTTRVYEQSGEFSTDVSSTKFSPYQYYVGVKSPQKGWRQLATGKKHKYMIATVDANGQTAPTRNVTIEVYKVSWYWWWESMSSSEMADYVSDSYNKPVKRFLLRTNSSGVAEFDLDFADNEWGTYMVLASDVQGGHKSGVLSYFDWDYMENRQSVSSGEAATQLKFTVDKDEYQPGDKISVVIPSSQGSRAIVSVCNGSKVLSTDSYECSAEQTTVKLPVTEDMHPNAYVCVNLIQPHSNTENDLPIRLYGVQPVKVTSPKSYLYPEISMDDEIKSESDYSISVSEKDGREMAYTLAIVDEGLLDLTHFKTPDPWAAFNAREALGVRMWDMYQDVVGAFGGRLEQIFSIGGDDALNNGPKAIVNRFTPIVKVEGPFILAKGKKQKHTFNMPNYNGRVRVMVIAGDGRAYGSTDKSVLVRKPIMLLGTLPRVIGVGETMDIPATVFATKDGVGNISTKIECSDNMEVVGGSTQTLTLNKQGDETVRFRIKVKDKSGTGYVKLTASAGGDKAVYETNIDIRSTSERQVKVFSSVVEAGKDWTSTINLPGIEGTNSLNIELSGIRPINLEARLSYLLGYPHGCIEQTTSKVFPQLYLSDYTQMSAERKKSTEENVKAGINRLRSFQLGNGLMSYWPGSNSPSDWGSVYAAHFLIEASKKGYLISGNMKDNLLSALRKAARDYNNTKSHGEDLTQCYRLYVLALASKAEMGAMNRMKEGSAKLTQTAKYLLASAYAVSGHADVAKTIAGQTNNLSDSQSWGYTYGSALRDEAIKLIMANAINDNDLIKSGVDYLSDKLSSDDWLSTQETAFSLFALAQYYGKNAVDNTLNYAVTLDGNNLATDKVEARVVNINAFENGKKSAKVNVKNNGKGQLFVRAITEGEMAQGTIEPTANRISISVAYVNEAGQAMSVDKLQQGTNFKARVLIENKSNTDINNLVLTQILPSGWESLSTPYIDKGGDANTLSYRDVRDDRVFSYVDLLRAGKYIELEIDLCATYSGEFYLPAVVCEAMYDNTIHANSDSRFVVVE